MQPPDPIIIVDLFPEILRGLLELLSGLSADEWQQTTVCAGWSVNDVTLHLLGGEIGNLSRRRDGHALGASIHNWDELVGYINDWNQDWVRTARRLSPRLLVDLLEYTGLQMCAYFRSLDPLVMGDSVSWVGPEPAPVWLDLAREYTERWHHQQHIRDALDKPGFKEPRYLAPVLSAFVWAMPRAFQSTHAPDKASVTLTIRGEAGGRWSLLQERGQWRLYQGAPAQPGAEVILDQDMAWRLFTRGLEPDVARRLIVINGERELGLQVLEMVAIIA